MLDISSMESIYVCPKDRTPLKLEGGCLRNHSGPASYPVVNDIPQFLNFGPAEDEDTKKLLDRLNALALTKGWREALKEVYGEDAQILKYVANESRESFIELLNLTPQSDVLEIGPGLGQFTASLARRARSVCAIEVVDGQSCFTAERCRQEGVSNVQVATGGDDCRLPYGNEVFDVVVVNLVLEWCAGRCVDENIVDVQRRFLDEACRVLRPGGTFYLATKNRFALRYLIGKPDEHSYNLRFGSALPRWLTGMLLKFMGYDRPRGVLYSYWALKRLLGGSGFERMTSYWAAPEMRYPTHYVPTDSASISAARKRTDFIQAEIRSTKLLMPLIPASLVKYVTPGLAFVAYKSGNRAE